jgi:hypothetical protein
MIEYIKNKVLGESRWRNPFNNGRYRNHQCFCGSGKKLKKCHGAERTLNKADLDEAERLFRLWEDSPEGILFFKNKRGAK